MNEPTFNVMESLGELKKLIQLMDEDANTLTASQAITDYIAPILDSMVSEIEVNRQLTVQTNDRVSLAMMMSEKTFLGDILTSIADHFSTIIDEIPEDTSVDSALGVAVAEIQDLIATWMNFDSSDEDFDDDDDDDDDEGIDDEDADASQSESDVEVLEAEVIVDAES
jgi:hypothetical protein